MPVNTEEKPMQTEAQIAAPNGTGQLPMPESDIPSADELAKKQAELVKEAQAGPDDSATIASEQAFDKAEAEGSAPTPAHETAKTESRKPGGILGMLGIKRSK